MANGLLPAALLLSFRLAAQDPNVDQVLADTLKDLRGDDGQTPRAPAKEARPSPIVFRESPPDKTTAQSVSAGRLRHKLPKKAQLAYQQGVKLLGARKMEEASSALRAAIAADPGFMQAHNALGMLYGVQGRYADAETEFHVALGLDPQASIPLYNLGVAYMRAGRFLEAEQSAREALRLAPTSAHAQLLLGYLLLPVPERRPEAIEYLRLSAKSLSEARELLRRLKAK